MSRMFGDIYEAIRYVRVTKGTTESKILEYVEDRAGGNLPTGKASLQHPTVMLTIRALQKLVEDGILCKNGHRYAFARRPPMPVEKEDKDEDDEEEEEADCGGCVVPCPPPCPPAPCPPCPNKCPTPCLKTPVGPNAVPGNCPDSCSIPRKSCCPAQKPCDDDDDNNETEDDDEEDDDDDDDDECDDAEMIPNNFETDVRTTSFPPISNDNNIARAIANNQNPMARGPNANISYANTGDKTLTSPKFENGKSSARKLDLDKDEKKEKTKGKKKLKKCGDKKKQSDAGKIKQKSAQVLAGMNSKKEKKPTRGSKNIKTTVKKNTAGLYMMNMDNVLDASIDTPSAHLLLNAVEGEMDADFEMNNDMNVEKDDIERLDFESYRHRSPFGTPPPNTPGVHLNRKESCCSNFDSSSPIGKNLQSLYEGNPTFSLMKNDSAHSLIGGKRIQNFYKMDAKESHKRELENGPDRENTLTPSLCTICEKKKRLS